jgi:hypothetical protein
MWEERANDLARLCTEVVRKGDDFPTVWQTLLKGHPLVEGIPRQRLDGKPESLGDSADHGAVKASGRVQRCCARTHRRARELA